MNSNPQLIFVGGFGMLYVDLASMHSASRAMHKALEERRINDFIQIGHNLLNCWYGDRNSDKFRDSLMCVNENTAPHTLTELADYPRRVALEYEARDRQVAAQIRSMFSR